MSNIVVGVDGSESAMTALGWARQFGASQPNPEFQLVHAFSLTLPLMAALTYQDEPVYQQSLAEGRALLNRAAGALGNIGKSYPWLMQEDPVDALLRAEGDSRADLVAVGRRGLGRVASLLLGSVSMGVLHGARCPVLLVHDAPPRQVRRVMVALDGSDHSVRSLSWAAAWAPEAQLTTLHVIHTPVMARAVLDSTDVSFDGAVDRQSRHVAEHAMLQAGVDPSRVLSISTSGDPAEEVVREYNHGPYDLLVLGSRGHGALGERLLGTVSDQVVRLVHGPVVVVK